MTPPPKLINVPETYQQLSYTEIKISNYPQSSSIVTPIQILTLYRPGRHNAFTGVMVEELEHVFQLFDIDDRVKCIIVTGHGRVFCAGADLSTSFRQTSEKVNDHRDGYATTIIPYNYFCTLPSLAEQRNH
jgi:enoyl-CoA hydratase/carnithine racemase